MAWEDPQGSGQRMHLNKLNHSSVPPGPPPIGEDKKTGQRGVNQGGGLHPISVIVEGIQYALVYWLVKNLPSRAGQEGDGILITLRDTIVPPSHQ